jgi:hypothetical protein
MEKIPRWQLTSQPKDWSSYKNDNEVAWTMFESSIATVSAMDDVVYEDPHFVSFREARTFVSITTNEFYTAHGGKFVNEENRKKFKPTRIQYPGVSSLQYSARAPMSMVAREYCAKLDAEGEFLPYDAVRQIRKRTCKSGWDL